MSAVRKPLERNFHTLKGISHEWKFRGMSDKLQWCPNPSLNFYLGSENIPNLIKPDHK